MKNEIVVQIAATHNEVYGLTETGKICKLDTNINKMVLRCSEEILTADKANILTVFTPHISPVGKYNKGAIKNEENKNKKAYMIKISFHVVAGILLGLFVASIINRFR